MDELALSARGSLPTEVGIGHHQHPRFTCHAHLQPQQLRVLNLSANQCHQLHQAQRFGRPAFHTQFLKLIDFN